MTAPVRTEQALLELSILAASANMCASIHTWLIAHRNEGGNENER